MIVSLNQQLSDLHAERVRTWDPDTLRINVDQRRELVDAFNPASAVREGDIVEPFSLLDVEGGTITRDELVRDRPAVLIFFRFAGCPACNIALPYYEQALRPSLRRAGVGLIAISPQVPERLIEIKQRHRLGFTVASDPDNALGRQLGITFEANAATRAAAMDKGSWIGAVVGTGTWELPQPTVVILDPDHRVRFVDISPDWLVRTEAAAILTALEPFAEFETVRIESAEAALLQRP